MAKSDVFEITSKKRFEVAEASEIKLGLGSNFKAQDIGTLGFNSGS